MNSMLLAAGVGQRFRPHTEKLAKPAIPLLNLPLLSYPLFLLESLGPEKLIINTHHLPTTVRSAAESLIMNASYKLLFSDEQPDILNSAGGIGRVRHDLRGGKNFVVGNADTLFLVNDSSIMKKFLAAHKDSGALATTMALPHTETTEPFGGLWLDNDFNVKAIGARPVAGCSSHMYPGFIALNDEIFSHIPQGGASHIFNDVLLPAIDSGEMIKAFVSSESIWFETGDEKNYLHATRSLLQIMSDEASPYREFLLQLQKHFQMNLVQLTESAWAESGAQVSTSIETNLRLLVGANTTVEEGVKLKGFCVIGPNQLIPAGCDLENAVILNAENLNKNTIIKNKLIV